MEIVNGIRQILAYIIIVCFPPVLTLWYVAHGFVRIWRRAGLKITYGALGFVAIASGIAMYYLFQPYLMYDYGFDWRLTLLSLIFYAAAAAIEVGVRKHLSLRTLIGVPEFSSSDSGQMLHKGIYSRMRHPRYVSLILGVIAVSLFANYLIVYAFIPIFIIGIYCVTVLEERELIERFGESYREYQQSVPRFIPPFRSK